MIDTTGILPAPQPQVPVHRHPSGVYGSGCKVIGCGWGISDRNPATVTEQADLHRHQHVAGHTTQLVQRLEADVLNPDNRKDFR